MTESNDSADRKTGDRMEAEPWHSKLKDYQARFEKWKKQCEAADDLYSKDKKGDSADTEIAMFWATLEVLKPATYSREPKPVVAPRFKDGNQIASIASEALERCLVVSFEQSDLQSCMLEVRDDFLMYSRGTARVRLSTDDAGSPKLEYDAISADDFAHGTGRKWREVKWVAYRSWPTLEEGIERFGETFRAVPLKRRDPNARHAEKEDTAALWEIWDRASRKVLWVAEGHPEVLDEKEPFLKLSGFWPSPRPAFGTMVPKSLKPIPDFRQYAGQLQEINDYTNRIAVISQALRVRGFYPAGNGDLAEAIEAALKSVDDEAIFIPVASVASLGSTGFKDLVAWLPTEKIADMARQLIELRRVLIEDVYQITGISDIVRGSSQASETATAQQIKSQWGSVRIRLRQDELVRFSRDLSRISAEMIAENFDPETIVKMSQLQLPTAEQKQQAQSVLAVAQQAQNVAAQTGVPPQLAPDVMEKIPLAQAAMEKPALEEVMKLLRDDQARGFIIEIETDSTIQADEDAEKQRRIEFVTAIGGMAQQAFPLLQSAPQLAPFIIETLRFAAQGFRAGRPLEGTIDKLAQQVEQMAKQAQQGGKEQPNPKVIELQAQAVYDAQKRQLDATADQQKRAADLDLASQKHAMTMAELERKDAVDAKKAERELLLITARPTAPSAQPEGQLV